MAELWFKWMGLVWLNAIIGLFFADIGQDWLYNAGIILGVCAFIPLYVLIDAYAINTGNTNLQKSLLIGVIVRACLQVVMVVDIAAGIIASAILEGIFGSGVLALGEYGVVRSGGFWYGFLMTITTGVILSGVVAMLVFFIMLAMGFFQKTKP